MLTRFAFVLIAFTTLAMSAAVGQDVQINGQLRPRFEYRDRNDDDDQFTSMRMRATINALLEGNVRVVMQVQDVRLFGEELNTLTDFSADNFDLHQGYIDVLSEGPTMFSARVGRQEVLLGGERLVGPVGWTQQGRAFDGIRFGATGAFGSVALFGFKLAESTSPNFTAGSEFFGAYVSFDDIAGGALDIYGLYDRIDDVAETKRGTIGVRLAGSASDFSYRGEASYQLGDDGPSSIKAFMLGARVGTSLADGDAGVTLWYDYLSGDDDPTDGNTKVFDTLYGTNHKFYGFADLFLNIPAHTAGLGLQDLAIKTRLNATSDTRLMLDVHHFRAAKTGTLSGGRFGEELDFTARHQYSGNLAVTAGASYILQGNAWAEIGRLTENSVWVYAMLDATF